MTVSNALGTVNSSNAILTVNVLTMTQPQDQSVFAGATASFNVIAQGEAPLSDQWYFNGNPLSDDDRVSGSTTTNLVISNIQTNDSGLYQLVVTNNYGAITSAMARLTVLIQITSQPLAVATLVGSNVTFDVAAIGTLPLSYHWYFNETPLGDDGQIGGAATPTLSISNVQTSDAGDYQVVVTNPFNIVTSLTASLVLLPSTAITVHYVDLNKTNPLSPYLDWSTSATNIQDAIDAAAEGDYIMVANGVYQSGGRVVYGSLTNRLAVTKAVVVQSAYGAAATIIQGNRTLGNSAVRCVYLTNNAVLIGFTLTSGATRLVGDAVKEVSGGGVWCESSNAFVLDSIIVTNQSFNFGGGVYSGTLSNCTLLRNNGASGGGGAYSSVLRSCTLIGNSVNSGSFNGGGAYSSFLDNCAIISNSASFLGGGAYNSVLTNCTLTGNSAKVGAGACLGTLNLSGKAGTPCFGGKTVIG